MNAAPATLIYQLRLRIAQALYLGPSLRSRLAYIIDPRSGHFHHLRRSIGQ